MEPKKHLIFDIGCHRGEDSDFYLRKGFRVIAVEANPILCNDLKTKFATQIADGRLTLIDKAIAEKDGEVTFFINDNQSIWGTIRAEMAERNEIQGSKSRKVTVPAIKFGSLIKQFGMPYYLKIDIEGADLLCLEGLLEFKDRPVFISHEHDQEALAELAPEITMLKKLGYTKFKIVDQGAISKQKAPFPAREGVYVDSQIEAGSSGLFGNDLPGPWLSRAATIIKYLKIFARNKLVGAIKRIPGLNRTVSNLPGSWYDTHATR
jgi:FkbM family methyltransferase